ncbi:MAG: Asp-tRNA(Asn)/Glu-tRNA(Gln) amidotransferase subunit GatC [Candidatus Aenigmatarchaeota archaeon]
MDKETIKKVAEVARLNLTENEFEEFEKSFGDILGHFAILQNAKLEEPEKQEGGANILRDDKADIDRDIAKKIMENAPVKEDKLLKVPKGSK